MLISVSGLPSPVQKNMHLFKGALNLALFIVVGSGLLLLLEEPGTAEFVVTVLSLGVGVVFLLLVAWVIKRTSK